MIVLPCSQLTILIVPASTLRRNEETMSGITPSTPTRTAATMISICVMGVDPLVTVGVARFGLAETDAGHRTAIACTIYFLDADDITRPDANASGAVCVQLYTKHLHQLATQLQGNQPIAVRVESSHSPSLR